MTKYGIVVNQAHIDYLVGLCHSEELGSDISDALSIANCIFCALNGFMIVPDDAPLMTMHEWGGTAVCVEGPVCEECDVNVGRGSFDGGRTVDDCCDDIPCRRCQFCRNKFNFMGEITCACPAEEVW